MAKIKIEVAYASEHEQVIMPIEIASGATLADAIDASGLLQRFPEIDLQHNLVGIFSQRAKLTDIVQSGDRVEIYRPLKIDPKQARRERAQSDK